ncbi:hypothetical protein PMAYCL1PPCAC_10406 [Pristionchus mayeri]|uniref:RNase NYN domain-containing protein n=1 Tax=Pristionchus mayeri TaxID=1317129 RepID=A0AAN4ZJI8_9BILA|nr:hypothetical protein PMAYCL1PPCAC_10406 [Pristionchus mayeri]
MEPSKQPPSDPGTTDGAPRTVLVTKSTSSVSGGGLKDDVTEGPSTNNDQLKRRTFKEYRRGKGGERFYTTKFVPKSLALSGQGRAGSSQCAGARAQPPTGQHRTTLATGSDEGERDRPEPDNTCGPRDAPGSNNSGTREHKYVYDSRPFFRRKKNRCRKPGKTKHALNESEGCILVASSRCMWSGRTKNLPILRKLEDLGVLLVVDRGKYDDEEVLELAGEFDGVIISADQYRREQKRKDFMTTEKRNSLKLRVSPIYPLTAADFLPRNEWGQMSKNGHFIVDHLMRFAGTTQELRNKFFSSTSRGGKQFNLVEKRHATWLHNKERVLKTLDSLVAKIQPIMMKTREDVPTIQSRGN